jgi:uncharacterized protein
MKIGVISDTHDNLMALKKAIEIFKERGAELIIHCGDWISPFTVEFLAQNITIPIRGIIGNNPGDLKRIMERNSKLENPIDFTKGETIEMEIDGRKIITCHGDDKLLLDGLISSKKYDAVFTGHTHVIRNELTENNTLVINPGTTCYASNGQIIDFASIAIYDSIKNSAEIIKF